MVSMTAPFAGEKTTIAAVPPIPKEPVVELTQKKRAATLVKKVSCDRCGGEHIDLTMTRLSKPIQSRSAKVAFNYWAACPETGEPLLLLLLG